MRNTTKSFGLSLSFATFSFGLSGAVMAQEPENELRAAPPPDATALVAGPGDGAAPPTIEKPSMDSTSATVSAGGQLATGNSRMLAATANGTFDLRRGYNAVGASALGNYGRAGIPGEKMEENANNLQLRLRYDRFFTDSLSGFLIGTGRVDKFQGLLFRLNIDPGVKYLFINQPTLALWGEVGYDYQHDIRRDGARIVLDGDGNPVLDADGDVVMIDKTADDHSSRLYVGFRHAFNAEVTLSTGLEYLQSFTNTTRYRLNYDAVFAAKIIGGVAFGVGFTARYDHKPLPGKEELDTATTLNLIYTYSDAVPPPAPPPPCPPPPVAEPAPAPSPAVEPVPVPAPATPAAAEPPSASPAPASAGPETTTAPAAPAPAEPAPATP